MSFVADVSAAGVQDQELELVHQGVKRLGVMAQDMNTELKIQNAMIQETKAKADSVNENLLQ
jgi:hypothetical protein